MWYFVLIGVLSALLCPKLGPASGVRGSGPPQDPTVKESVFVFGIIDLLQVWNNKKRVESAAKTKLLGRDEHGISAVKPDEYSVRFHEFLTQRLEE